MGYIQSSLESVINILNTGKLKSVCDLGAQNNYTVPYLPAPYMSEWYKKREVDYMSVDLSGENDSKTWDLCEPVKTTKKFDLVTNCGTLEHVKDLYQGFANMDKLCKVGGLLLNENPRTGNWPQHCYHYFDEKFFLDLAIQADYEIVEIKNTVSAHNYETGNNVFALFRKKKEGFIERENFPVAYES
jgi:SAM-dependent methyltransferase